MEIIGIAILFYIGWLVAPFVIMFVIAVFAVIGELLFGRKWGFKWITQ